MLAPCLLVDHKSISLRHKSGNTHANPTSCIHWLKPAALVHFWRCLRVVAAPVGVLGGIKQMNTSPTGQHTATIRRARLTLWCHNLLCLNQSQHTNLEYPVGESLTLAPLYFFFLGGNPVCCVSIAPLRGACPGFLKPVDGLALPS